MLILVKVMVGFQGVIKTLHFYKLYLFTFINYTFINQNTFIYRFGPGFIEIDITQLVSIVTHVSQHHV